MEHSNDCGQLHTDWEQIQAGIRQLAKNDVGAALKALRSQELFYIQQQHEIRCRIGYYYKGPQALEDSYDEIDERLKVISGLFRTYLAQRPLIVFASEGGRNIAMALPPPLGERILLLILTKEERFNIPGDLAEEFVEITVKHGTRYAKLWYYKQVASSAWPMIRKAVKWGMWAWVGDWIRRNI